MLFIRMRKEERGGKKKEKVGFCQFLIFFFHRAEQRQMWLLRLREFI